VRYTAITYIGTGSDFTAEIRKENFYFVWQNSLGVGKGEDEIPENVAIKLSKWRDEKGERLFTLE
jgi:hypothetical protein|tara:strand:- start:2360 stop:2554 length:195 start_codon:yes stop_codon:yes gene_type:complete